MPHHLLKQKINLWILTKWKKKGKKRNKNQKLYKLRSSFLLREKKQEQKPRKLKTQKHLVDSRIVWSYSIIC